MLFTVWVTEKCNLHCKYCYVEGAREEKYFKEENIKALCSFINENSDDEYNVLNFFGGEPLLAIGTIEKILHELKKYSIINLFVWMTTNGTLIDERACKLIKENDFQLSISIDGNKDTHDFNRIFHDGKGTFESVNEGYNKLSKYGIKNIRIRGTYNSKSVFYLDENIDFLVNHYDGIIVFAPDLFDKDWTEDGINELKRIYIKYLEEERVTVIDKCETVSLCGGGTSSVYVDADGDLYPCSYIVKEKKYKIGNIYEGICKNKLKSINELNEKRIQTCDGCSDEFLCKSFKCKFLNKMITGNELVPAPIVCHIQNMLHEVRGSYNEKNCNN